MKYQKDSTVGYSAPGSLGRAAKVGDVRHQGVDVTGAADALVDGDLVDHDLAELLGEACRAGTMLLDLCLQL
jgi:hypothetical protein